MSGRVAVQAVDGGAGKLTVTLSPPPATDAATTVPWCAATTARTMDSPRPDPVPEARCTPRRNGSNSSPTVASSTAAPVELTYQLRTAVGVAPGTYLQPTAVHVVSHGVLHQVPNDPLQQRKVAKGRGLLGVQPHPQPSLVGLRTHGGQRRTDLQPGQHG